MTAHVCAILAAGGSRRLGRPKQLLTRDGEALLRRIARLAAQTRPTRTLVVLGAHHDRIAPALDGLDCERVVNPDWASGVAGSLAILHAALRGHAGPVLLSACDLPGARVEDFQALLRAAREAPARIAAVRHADGAGIPVVVPAPWLAPGAEVAGDRGIAVRLRRLPAGACGLLDLPTLRADLDTEDDVRAAIANGWLDAVAAR